MSWNMGPASSAKTLCVILATLALVAGVAAAASPAGPASGHGPAAPAPGQMKDDNKPKDDKPRHGKPGHDGELPPAPPTAPAPPSTAAPAPPPAPVPVPPPAQPAAPMPAGASAAPSVALAGAPLTPTVAASVGLASASGTVLVRTAGDQPAQPLAAASAVPVGTRVDARAGTVELTAALDASGRQQTATFSGAVFEVRQPRGRGGLTQIVLARKGAPCAPIAGRRGRVIAGVAKRRRPVASLWGQDDHGAFQTRGRGSVATVRGTRWLTQDFCDGTRTRVVSGAVAVRDLGTGRTVVVHAGHSHFARVAKR